MHSTRQIYLPTEVVVQIVRFVAADDAHRQEALYACCLVSRQWYSAAVSFLYEKPRLHIGNSFQQFVSTCSGVGVRRNKLNLGSFVRRLDLSRLVHHSSNSVTARLLGRVKENLEVFVAPRVSFAVNSLPALSKCTNLRHLDLSLVADPIPFPNLKKAFSRLPRLRTLRLPRSTNLDVPDSSRTEWPPLLHKLQLSGQFSATTIPSFPWPPALTSLTLKNCTDLSVTSIACLLSSPQLSETLKHLTISYANRRLEPGSINAVTAFLPGLTFLSVPGDMVDETFFDVLYFLSPPLALEVLEFDMPNLDPVLHFETSSLIMALDKGLSNVRSIGFSDIFCTDERIVEDEEVDDVLYKHARQRAEQGAPTAVDETEVGVYYM
ncbi:F-box protein YDR306C [Aspergillus udagawae]|uniref:F-box protein YDR306C n=1 Tax=Aspergillus udagawae TaxID=91492 RepID=A0ABQ1AVI4_9EURO|nr:F-box protein YDR306C [Aspergillus udagawae]GFF88781.1 F-box protein YDR306C [Aspergillus udagawae]GFG13677.1 F-box protein YDR306C [Aspergillus udagawae]GFG27050.1 F-box protein YDR306C [Aspergillus udagawae]